MRTDEDIIEEYTHADWAKRLNLYLEYRDLRGTFYQVEVEERHNGGRYSIPMPIVSISWNVWEKSSRKPEPFVMPGRCFPTVFTCS